MLPKNINIIIQLNGEAMRVLLVLLFGCVLSTNVYAQGSISGIVRAKRSGEAAIGAQVLLYADSLSTSPFRRAVTNTFGYFSLPQLRQGTYTIFVRSLGFRTEKRTLSCGPDTMNVACVVQLDEDPLQLEGVTIEGARDMQIVPAMSSIDVSPQLLQTIPSLGAETDLFRAMQLLPGVKTSSEVSSGLYVRGGGADQNLVLLDGAIVYNPFHLAGFLSSFNTDALLNIRLLKGAFPAEYGGRLSSVIDLAMREGTKEEVTGRGGISLISSKLTVEGPIAENMTFMISGRRMYLDLIVALAGHSHDAPKYYFYDLNAKLNYSFSDRDRIFLSGYFGRDVVGGPPSEPNTVIDISWGNATANLRWMHIVGPSLFTNFSLIYTKYDFSSMLKNSDGLGSQDGLDNFHALSRVRDLEVRGEAQYSPDDRHVIKTGVDLTLHSFRADASAVFQGEVPTNETTLTSLEGALYMQDEWSLTQRLSANLGARLFYFQEGGYVNLEPRLSLSYALSDETSVKGAYSVGHQYLHLISRDDIVLPTDMWFPSTAKIAPGESWQAVIGIETMLPGDEYLASVEAYYKEMKNLYQYRDKVQFTLGVPLEEQFTRGSGEAYGAEIFINKRVGSFTGWLGYTLAWTRVTYPELNLGRAFYPSYDRRHDVSLVLNYKLGGRWELGAAWVYATGQAITAPAGFYAFKPIEGSANTTKRWESNEYATERNGYRLPAYHRLDVNFIYNTSIFGLASQLSFNIYNAYNKKNIFTAVVETDVRHDPPRNKLDAYTLFPIIPTIGWNFKF